MNLVRWRPRRDLRRFEDEMLRVFDDFFPRYWQGEEALTNWMPSVDVSETDGEITIEADLPGMKKDDIKVSVENNTLTIQGERKQEKKKERGKYHSTERSYGSFYRAIDLPAFVDEKKIKADFKNGTLNINLPKKEEARPKQIEIDVS